MQTHAINNATPRLCGSASISSPQGGVPCPSPPANPRCLILVFDGALFSLEWKQARWARFCMGAPPRQRRSVERYKRVKRASERFSSATASIIKTVASWNATGMKTASGRSGRQAQQKRLFQRGSWQPLAQLRKRMTQVDLLLQSRTEHLVGADTLNSRTTCKHGRKLQETRPQRSENRQFWHACAAYKALR